MSAPRHGGTREAAFAEHVLPHVALLHRAALSLTGQSADAEDLVQDTLIRTLRAVERFDGEITDPVRVRAMAEHLEECRRCGLEAETYTTLKVALAGPGAAQPGSAGEPPEPSR